MNTNNTDGKTVVAVLGEAKSGRTTLIESLTALNDNRLESVRFLEASTVEEAASADTVIVLLRSVVTQTQADWIGKLVAREGERPRVMAALACADRVTDGHVTVDELARDAQEALRRTLSERDSTVTVPVLTVSAVLAKVTMSFKTRQAVTAARTAFRKGFSGEGLERALRLPERFLAEDLKDCSLTASRRRSLIRGLPWSAFKTYARTMAREDLTTAEVGIELARIGGLGGLVGALVERLPRPQLLPPPARTPVRAEESVVQKDSTTERAEKIVAGIEKAVGVAVDVGSIAVAVGCGLGKDLAVTGAKAISKISGKLKAFFF